MKHVMKTFDFWVKVLYSIRILIAVFVDSNFIQYYQNVMFVFICILWTVLVASFHALFINVKMKITIAIIIGIVLTLCYINAMGMDESKAIKYNIIIINFELFVYDPLTEVKNCLQVVIILYFVNVFY